jgi:effector-binding domain-containing protein
LALIWRHAALADLRFRRSRGDLRPLEKDALCITEGETMNLIEEPEIVDWPEIRYVFVEKTGPFAKVAPEAWQTAYSLAPLLAEHNRITGSISLYKMNPNVYRACFMLAAEPVKVPAGLEYETFGGGKYSSFVLTGPYSNLPAATGRVFEIVSKKDMMLRSDFNIENYVSDPRTTPPEQLITEILVPTA